MIAKYWSHSASKCVVSIFAGHHLIIDMSLCLRCCCLCSFTSGVVHKRKRSPKNWYWWVPLLEMMIVWTIGRCMPQFMGIPFCQSFTQKTSGINPYISLHYYWITVSWVFRGMLEVHFLSFLVPLCSCFLGRINSASMLAKYASELASISPSARAKDLHCFPVVAWLRKHLGRDMGNTECMDEEQKWQLLSMLSQLGTRNWFHISSVPSSIGWWWFIGSKLHDFSPPGGSPNSQLGRRRGVLEFSRAIPTNLMLAKTMNHDHSSIGLWILW